MALAAATSSAFAAAQPEPATKVFNLTTTIKQLDYQTVKMSKKFKDQWEGIAYQSQLQYNKIWYTDWHYDTKKNVATWVQHKTKKVNGVDIKVPKWVTVKQNYLLVISKDGSSGKCTKFEKLLAYDKQGKQYRYWVDKNSAVLNMNYEDSGDVSISMTITDQGNPGDMRLCGSGKAAYSNPNDKKKDKTFPDYVTSASGNLVIPGKVGEHHRFGTWKLSYDKKATGVGTTNPTTILSNKKLTPYYYRPDFDD